MPRRIKVLHMIPDLPVAGAERVVTDLVCRADKQRFESAVLSMYAPRGTAVEEELASAGIPVHYLGKHRGLDLRMIGRIRGVVRRFSPDIVHTHRYVLRYVLPLIRMHRLPVVLHTIHNMPDKDIGRPLWYARMAYASAKPVAICDIAADGLRRLFGIEPCRVIPNGIDISHYRPNESIRRECRGGLGLADDEVACLAVGRLSSQKNHALLLSAIARIRDGGRPVRLFIAGLGELHDALMAQVDSLGLGGQVDFLGVRSDIPELLAAADIFVLPSAWEGNPLTVMEAMAAGRAVVATAVGGVPELIDDGVTGRLVAPGSVDELAAALDELASDPVRRETIGEQAAREAERRFDVARMVEAYEELYEELKEESHG